MKKKKILLIIGLVFSVVSTLTIYYAYNYKIIKDEYTQLTITMGKTTYVIQDNKKISEVVHKINNSPREFQFPPSSGFKYDYYHHGLLVLENELEKKEFRIVYSKNDQVNVLTEHWEFKTGFNFSQPLE
ncbi:hypothetical protein ABN702_15865 [Bacillus haimaensis]|uniref:hypothetical protein n=1 Tax=Bacillus haimaensis TaxID=3160967 RepID=UPI003AA9CB8D